MKRNMISFIRRPDAVVTSSSNQFLPLFYSNFSFNKKVINFNLNVFLFLKEQTRAQLQGAFVQE